VSETAQVELRSGGVQAPGWRGDADSDDEGDSPRGGPVAEMVKRRSKLSEASGQGGAHIGGHAAGA